MSASKYIVYGPKTACSCQMNSIFSGKLLTHSFQCGMSYNRNWLLCRIKIRHALNTLQTPDTRSGSENSVSFSSFQHSSSSSKAHPIPSSFTITQKHPAPFVLPLPSTAPMPWSGPYCRYLSFPASPMIPILHSAKMYVLDCDLNEQLLCPLQQIQLIALHLHLHQLHIV